MKNTNTDNTKQGANDLASCLITKENGNNIRFIHLKKFARMSGSDVSKNGFDRNKTRVEYGFNVMGYYDSMTYVRPVKMFTDYKHEFCIDYPYTKPSNSEDILNDQYFSLIDIFSEQDSDEPSLLADDPFEYKTSYEDENPLPFLGLLLVSFEMATGQNGKKFNETYNDLLHQIMRDVHLDLQESLKTAKNNEALMGSTTEEPEATENAQTPTENKDHKQLIKSIGKVYLTLNCANFAVAIRTNYLHELYRIRSKIATSRINVTRDGETVSIGPEFTFTSFLCGEIAKVESIQNNGVQEDRVFNHLTHTNVQDLNKDLRINMRISLTNLGQMNRNFTLSQKEGDETKTISEWLSDERMSLQNLGGTDDRFYEILGAGDYSITLSFKHYSELYLYICKLRYFDNKTPKSSEGLTHSEKDELILNYLISEFTSTADSKYINKVRNVFERFRFPGIADPDSDSVKPDSTPNKAELYLTVPSRNLKSYIEFRISSLQKYRDNMGEMAATYDRAITLLKDLNYTFCNLCQGKKFAIHGHIFILQMYILVDSIEKNMDDYLDKLHSTGSDTPTLHKKDAIDVCQNIKMAILAINNYNKMLQTLNQDAINNQGFEIQTRVNSEKSMLAYTAFLLHLYDLYIHSEHVENPPSLQLFPMVFLNLNENTILTERAFGITDFTTSKTGPESPKKYIRNYSEPH